MRGSGGGAQDDNAAQDKGRAHDENGERARSHASSVPTDAAGSRAARTRAVLEHDDLFASPAVRLELQFLRELDRLTVSPDEILGGLEADCGVRTTDALLARVVSAVMSLSWTRDPFDRLIVADAQLHGAALVTRDRCITANFPAATW